MIKSREFFDCITSNGDKQKTIESIVASEYLYTQVENVSGILLTKLTESFLIQNISDKHVVISNAIGFLFQASDSTTGLLGKMLIRHKKSKNIKGIDILNEVLDQEPPIKNTRRFKTGQGNHSNEKLIVIPLKTEEGTLPFGYGSHRCPGEIWGKTIALAAFEFLISLPLPDLFIAHYQWRDSPNASVPEFITY
ncbi:hypothetical protein PSI19_00760 [Xenorhabdus khoisanae]|uniref:hypothetical protein n=1 Tax=Xenorhabdus khoisanae TaxID=880157 RepID=UPI002359021F|nr:hypothetical protein [Xenorhabdus khoisanae]MDC9612434.1 hypothetical protein [Xenorhabdus khoisanae]